MVGLNPRDIGCDGRHAGFDPSVIDVDGGIGLTGLPCGIVEEPCDDRPQGWPMALQRQGMIATLCDNRSGKGAQQFNAPIVTMVSFNDSIASSVGTPVNSLGLTFAAFRSETIRRSQP